MPRITDQIRAWSGPFGREYTERNLLGPAEMDQLYLETYGVSRNQINLTFLQGMDRSIKILEVGTNIATQLVLLQRMRFNHLYGLEIQSHAVGLAKKNTTEISLIQGSAFDLPFENEAFDLVFTSGVLIHIHPSDIRNALEEIYRCSRRYIFGLEHYSKDYQPVSYRGREDLLWNADFARIYLDSFPGLELIKEDRYRYLANENIDSAFLLGKKAGVA